MTMATALSIDRLSQHRIPRRVEVTDGEEIRNDIRHFFRSWRRSPYRLCPERRQQVSTAVGRQGRRWYAVLLHCLFGLDERDEHLDIIRGERGNYAFIDDSDETLA